MPQIEVYSPPSSGQVELHPADFGERSTVQMARNTRVEAEQAGARVKAGVGEIAQAAGNIVKQYAHTDVTQALSGFATALTGQHDASEAFLKDPNLDISDPALAQKFMDQSYEPAMDKVRQGIKTQAGMDAFNEHYREYTMHFRQQFQRDLSTISGVHADAAMTNYFNQQTALIQQNPSALKPFLDTVDSTVRSMVSSMPNVDAETAAKLTDIHVAKAKTQAEETAVYSIGMQNPQAAMDMINKGELPDINGPQANMAMKQMMATQRQQAAMGRMEARQARMETQSNNFGKFLSSFGDAVQSGHVNPDLGVDALHAAGQGQVSGEQAITMYRLNEAALTHPNNNFDAAPALVQDLNSRAALNPGDPNRLTDLELGQMAAQRQIDMPTLKKYHEIIDLALHDPVYRSDMQDFNKAIDSFKSMVAPTGGMLGAGADPGQLVKFNQYMGEKMVQFQKLRGTGIDVNDVLYNPSSTNYLFKDIARAGIDPKEAAANTLKTLSAAGAATPYVPHLLPSTNTPEQDRDYWTKQGLSQSAIDLILKAKKVAPTGGQ